MKQLLTIFLGLLAFNSVKADRSGRMQIITLSDMQPDERYPLVLRNVNSQYAFEVVRTGGFSVVKY
jgi:hypothetical protein